VNKNFIIAGAVIVLIIIAAGAYLLMGKNQSTENQQSSAPNQENASVFSTIKDALSKSVSLECNFTDESGRSTVSYIKNGAVRANISASDPSQSGSVIVKDNRMYFWNEEGGFTMEFTDEMMEGVAPTGQSSQGQDIVATLEKYKESCKAAVVSDSLFTPPSDVKFQDYSSMIKNLAPTGSSSAPAVDQQKVKEMMEKFQNQDQ
jgi:hypothetical protein